uniref:FTH domain-containing protein n=1 Tax=Caenorhabditis tropicalis TaxID=1561998 RepID=A0A1I7SYY1_9PELO
MEIVKKRTDLDALLSKSTGASRKKLEHFLSSIGCDVSTWYQTLGGHQVRIILRESHIDSIFDILRDTPQNTRVKKAMKGFAKLMSFSNNRSYMDSEIDDIEIFLKEFLNDMKLAFPKEAITPMLHLLGFHLIDYM